MLYLAGIHPSRTIEFRNCGLTEVNDYPFPSDIRKPRHVQLWEGHELYHGLEPHCGFEPYHGLELTVEERPFTAALNEWGL